MEKPELKQRIIEKMKKLYPEWKIKKETDEWIEFGDKRYTNRVFYEKMLEEINVSHPMDWQNIIDKRLESLKKLKQETILRLVPRRYAKQSLPSPEELRKAGIIFEETEDSIILLAAETSDKFMTLSEEKYLELGVSKEEIERAKKHLKEMI